MTIRLSSREHFWCTDTTPTLQVQQWRHGEVKSLAWGRTAGIQVSGQLVCEAGHLITLSEMTAASLEPSALRQLCLFFPLCPGPFQNMLLEACVFQATPCSLLHLRKGTALNLGPSLGSANCDV